MNATLQIKLRCLTHLFSGRAQSKLVEFCCTCSANVLWTRSVQLDAKHSSLESASSQDLAAHFAADINSHRCLQDKPNGDLLRAALVLKLCSYTVFVKNAEQALHLSQKMLGERLTGALMRFSFYGQFCIGENSNEILMRSEKLLQNEKLKSILCITAEEASSPVSSGNLDLREEWYEDNKRNMCKCLDITSQISESNGALYPAQFKLTAVLDAAVCRTLSSAIRGGVLDVDKLLAVVQNPEKLVEYDVVTGAEAAHFRRALSRFKEILEKAREANVSILVDAEHSDINPALHYLAIAMMCLYNKNEPLVQYTYQCYLKASLDDITRDLRFCRDRGLSFGAKVVRGAYLDWERDFAQRHDLECAVHDSWEKTNHNYDKVVSTLIEELSKNEDVQVLIATHNEHSVRTAATKIIERGIDPQDERVAFAQLYGLSDHLSNWLAQTNFTVYKSSPIGAVQETLPYLVRRARENSSIMQGSRQDLNMIRREMRYRVRGKLRLDPS